MDGNKVNTYTQDNSDILALQLTTDKTFKGYHQLTLTEYNTTTVPAIAAGSAIECNGALYKFDTEEAISTTDPVTSATVADGTVYVCIVPGATTATAAFTATAPTWSDSKQGWYGTGDYANYRYAEFAIVKAMASYIKYLFTPKFKTLINVTNTNIQNVSSSDATKIIYDAKIIDSNNEFDAATNYRFTAKRSGCYLISGQLQMDATGGADLILYKNNSPIEANKVLLNLFTNFGSFSYLALLVAGDYLEIFINSASDTSYQIATSMARLNIVQVD